MLCPIILYERNMLISHYALRRNDQSHNDQITDLQEGRVENYKQVAERGGGYWREGSYRRVAES